MKNMGKILLLSVVALSFAGPASAGGFIKDTSQCIEISDMIQRNLANLKTAYGNACLKPKVTKAIKDKFIPVKGLAAESLRECPQSDACYKTAMSFQYCGNIVYMSCH